MAAKVLYVICIFFRDTHRNVLFGKSPVIFPKYGQPFDRSHSKSFVILSGLKSSLQTLYALGITIFCILKF